MGLWDSIKNFGSRIFSRVKEGIQKVIPVVKKFAPIVQKIAGAVPHPYGQAVSKGAGFLSGILGNAAGGE